MKSPTAGKTMFSVLFCISGTGVYLPPYTIYKAKHVYDSWTFGGPKDAAYSCSDSGWMMDTNFESWFINVFVKHTESHEKPVLLTFDGHNSHLTYNTVKAAMDNDIVILCLPPNTSHALQPLDVGVFRAVKVSWKRILNKWFTESCMTAVDKAVFPTLLARLWQQLDPMHAINAFRGAGLYPCDRAAAAHRVTAVKTDVPSGRVSPAPTAEGGPSTPASTPQKVLRAAILDVLSPEPSTSTMAGQKQKKRKRTRVQAKIGEVLTEESVLARLEKEMINRKEKKASCKPTTTQTSSKQVRGSPIKKKKVKRSLLVELGSSESDGEVSDNFLDSNSENEVETHVVGSVDINDLVEAVTYVIVQYEGSHFPGVVKKIAKKGVAVSCMQKSMNNTWKWPEREDVCSYELKNIVEIIQPPSLVGSRGQYYVVPEAERYWELKA